MNAVTHMVRRWRERRDHRRRVVRTLDETRRALEAVVAEERIRQQITRRRGAQA